MSTPELTDTGELLDTGLVLRVCRACGHEQVPRLAATLKLDHVLACCKCSQNTWSVYSLFRRAEPESVLVGMPVNRSRRAPTTAELVDIAAIDPEGFQVTCRICGCTDAAACRPGCCWIADPHHIGDLCSACARPAEILAQVTEALSGPGGAGTALNARQLAVRTGIPYLELVSVEYPGAPTVLEFLVERGHLQLRLVDELVRLYALPGDAS